MSKRFPVAQWVLPEVIDPPTSTCWLVPVPDDKFHRAAFLGALAALGAAYKWQDDPDHKAKQVAQVWRNIADALEKCGPSGRVEIRIYEDDTPMPIRIDCDCRVWALCCDGTEVELATVGMINKPGQPGPAPRPGPGITSCQKFSLNAKGQAVFPAPVSTGDIITINNADGGWNDGSVSWYCPNGGGYVGPTCNSGSHVESTDPLPTQAHMSLIGIIDGGAAIFSINQSPYTVPAGISGAQMVFQANDQSLPDDSGDITFEVCVENTSTPPAEVWCYVLDFTLSDWGFTGYPEAWAPGGVAAAWASGLGWHSVTDGTYSAVEIQSSVFGSTNIESIEVFYHVDTAMLGGIVTINNNVTVYGSLDPTVGDHDTLITSGVGLVTRVLAFISKLSGAPDTNTVISKMIINGSGPKPFGDSTC